MKYHIEWTTEMNPTHWCRHFTHFQIHFFVVNLYFDSNFTESVVCLHVCHLNNPHDYVIKWKHFPRNWPFMRGTHRSRWLPYTNRRAANPPKVLYLRSLLHPPTHLVCNDHPVANFLSFHMSLVVVMNCGAGNALRGSEISMFYFFLKLYFIHISKDILPLRALNAIKQCK